MHSSHDMQLLGEYVKARSDAAFAELVSRHINLVYSAAMRSVNNASEAEEITQSVFVTLAKKAATLRRGTVLSGWLYQAARLTARNYIRSETRRQQREQEALSQSTMNAPDSQSWTNVGPLLDEAMAELSEKDRNAIVLRFFEGKPLKDVGLALDASEDAAKMRVNRALEKLREIFHDRGITITSAALAAIIAGNSIEAAPAGLAASVAAAAAGIGHGAVATASVLTLAKGALNMMTSTKIGLAVGACAAVAVFGLEYREISNQRQKVRELQEQAVQVQQTINKSRPSDELQARVKELEKQNAGYARTIESMKNDVLKARAGATAALNAKAAAASAQQGGGLSGLFNDPSVMAALREQQAAMLRSQYGPFVKQMDLTPEQAEKFYQILTDQAAKGMETLQSGKIPELSNDGKSSNASLEALLGDNGLAKFNDFSQTMAAQAVLNQYNNSFQEHPLTDSQQQQLLQAIKTATANANSSENSGSQIDPGNASAMLGKQSEMLEQANQNVLQQAASFLAPDQLQMLGSAQASLLAMQKFGLTMAQKMFTNGPSGQ